MVILQYVPKDRYADTARQAPRAPTGAPTTTRTPPPRPADRLGDLAVLLDEAAVLPLDDRTGWARLTATARDHLHELIALGSVPRHLAVRDGEPPVVVGRTIAAAWRHATVLSR